MHFTNAWFTEKFVYFRAASSVVEKKRSREGNLAASHGARIRAERGARNAAAPRQLLECLRSCSTHRLLVLLSVYLTRLLLILTPFTEVHIVRLEKHAARRGSARPQPARGAVSKGGLPDLEELALRLQSGPAVAPVRVVLEGEPPVRALKAFRLRGAAAFFF